MLQKEKQIIIHNKFLHRPRIDALLAKGLEKPLITVEAASGYGKTRSIRNFFKTRTERVVWLNLTKHDDVTIYFWHSFANAFNLLFPKLAKTMEYIGFPYASSKFEVLLRYLAKEVYAGERIVLVADDYDIIHNPDIKLFFKDLVESGIENFCLILINNNKTNIDVSLNKLLSISDRDFAFTKEEAATFLQLCDVQFSDEDFARVYEDAEGWPLAISLCVEYYHINQLLPESFRVHTPSLTDFFEREYFSRFSDECKLFLARLSFFQSFCLEMAEILNVGAIKNTIDNMKQHPFLSFDKTLHVFKFQKLYYAFLETKQCLLTEEQVAQCFLLAGEHFLKHGMYYQAADSFFKSKAYDKFLQALMNLPRKRISREYCKSILKHIEALPESFCSANYLVDYVKAFLLLNNMEMAKAWGIFIKLKDKFESENINEEERSLLGEIYLVLADISVRAGRDEFTYYYKKAYEYLPEGSAILNQKLLMLGNNQAFFLANNQPGEMEKMIEAVFSTARYAESVTQGSGSGFACLYAAEAWYLTYELEKAEDYAIKALYTAFAKEQHDIVCNSYMLLAKIALARGDYGNSVKQISKVINYVNALNVTELFELRDCIESWFNVITGDLDKLPNWVANYNNNSYPHYLADVGRSSLVYGIYLMAKGNYHDANNLLSKMDGRFSQPVYWSLCLISCLMKAVCFFKTDDNENTVKYFAQAYEMAYNNKIIMPFIEFGSVMHPILDLAKNYPGYNFDEAWIDLIYQKIISYEMNFIKFINEHYEGSRVETISESKLSVEEFEILKMLSQGKTTQEIQNNFSSDIKKIIMDIYIKLGAVNKLDAIRIAKSKKYI